MTNKIKLPLLISIIIASSIVMSSCGQTADVATFSTTADKDKPNQPVTLMLSAESKRLLQGKKPTVRLFEKYNSASSYPVKIITDEKNPNKFEISTAQLAAGEYRILAEIPYQSSFLGIPTGSTTRTVSYDFIVHNTLAGSCFNFDNKQDDVMGWSSSHVYIEDREQPISKTSCPGLFFVNTSWPAKLNQTTEGGSLFVPVSSECFPKTSNQMSKDPHWTFSINSPDLSARQDWQQIKSISFRIATGTMPIKISPEVNYLLDGKKARSHIIEPSKKTFEIAGEGWNTLEYPLELPKGAIVTSVKLHIYGVPEKTVGNDVNSIFVDGVCPVK